MSDFSQLVGEIFSRWGHVLTGITWIGLLYYFNFVQAPAFAGLEAGSRTDATAKLVPRALWWFRWGAVLTLLTGIMILGFQENFDMDYLKSIKGLSILTGAGLATIMFLNVWLVIWPNQKRVIANAQNVLAGSEADPAAAAAARRGLLASRTNTLLSIPMLWFMVATSHFVGQTDHYKIHHFREGVVGTIPGPGRTAILVYIAISIVVVGLIQANALGYLGGTGPGPTRKPLEDHRRTIIAGFVLWLIFMIIWEIVFGGPPPEAP